MSYKYDLYTYTDQPYKYKCTRTLFIWHINQKKTGAQRYFSWLFSYNNNVLPSGQTLASGHFSETLQFLWALCSKFRRRTRVCMPHPPSPHPLVVQGNRREAAL